MDPAPFEYQIEDGDIIVRDRDSGEVHWRGRPKKYLAASVVPIPENSDAIVLVPRSEKKRGSFKNLFRIDPQGSVLWEAELPDLGRDAYLKVVMQEHELVAWSWSGYMVEINWGTGKIEKQTFTK